MHAAYACSAESDEKKNEARDLFHACCESIVITAIGKEIGWIDEFRGQADDWRVATEMKSSYIITY